MPAQPFDAYLDTVCSGILSARGRKQARKELLDHLECRKEDFVSEGTSADAAVAAALESFGSADEVRAQIIRAHRKDNAITVGKGIGQFLLSLLVTGGLMFFQLIILFFLFDTDVYILHLGLLFAGLTFLSAYAARKQKILFPLFLIPPALLQLLYIWEGGASFLIVVPELLKDNLISFYKDIAYGEIIASPLSNQMMTAFILLYTAANILISIAAFRLKSKRTNQKQMLKLGQMISIVLLAVTVSSSALSFGAWIIPNGEPLDYISDYLIVPAADEAETQKILDFYHGKERSGTIYSLPYDKMYLSDETAYHVYYHHDLDSASIEAHAFRDGKELGTKNAAWNSADFLYKLESLVRISEDGAVVMDPEYYELIDRIVYRPQAKDPSILLEESYFKVSQDAFYKAHRSLVIFAPEKEAGYYVVIPVIDDAYRIYNAEIIPWPPEEDVHIYGNMNQNVYEIILKAPTPEGQHE